MRFTLLIASVLTLFLTGLIMVFSTTSAEIIDRSLLINTHTALVKQMASGFLGMALGTFVYRKGFDFFLERAPLLFLLGVFALLLVFVPGLGQTINGARRWLHVGPLGFQPSECMKILLPLALTYWAREKQLKHLLLLGIPLPLILLEPDSGTALLLFALFVAFLFLASIPLRTWFFPLLLALIALGGIASQMPHVQRRIEVYLHPETDLRGKGHQPYQAKIAAGSGRFWGRGFGESLQKMNYLPEARSDYIAAIFAEEMGFAGMLGLLFAYLTIAFVGFSIAFHAESAAGYYLASLYTFLLSIQAFINLGVVSGLLPSKGMTLPFFSHGGSSLIINFIALGFLLSIEKRRAPCAF